MKQAKKPGLAGTLRRLALVPLVAATAGCGAAAQTPFSDASRALAALSVFDPSSDPAAAPLIVGHRGGAGGRAPENTMSAFKLGPTLGAAAVECDVHCSKDGAMVVIHDDTVNRTTNGKGRVRDLTLEQLQKLDAGGGEHLPTLDELLSWASYQPDLGLVVEIKDKKKVCPELADKVVSAIRKAGLSQRVMVISFHREAVERVEQIQPDLRTGLLFLLRLNPVAAAKAIHTDALWPARQRTTTHLVQQAHSAKFEVFSWTLDATRSIEDARRVGADAVVTNMPAVAKNAFGGATTLVPAPGPEMPQEAEIQDQEDPEDLAE